MKEFVKNHKSLCILAVIAVTIVFAVYLFALFRPGFWYGDVFLYKKSELIFGSLEVYTGHDAVNSADYELTMVKEGMTTHMSFTVNETERYYEIVSDNSVNYHPDVTIYENEEKVFSGTYGAYLKDESGEPFEPMVTIGYYPYEPTEEELFPSYNWLYNVSQSVKTEIRGEPLWLICIVIILAYLAIDMIHPDFFWELEHSLHVDGGTPSDYYRLVQKAGWVISPFIILALMIASFVVTI